jgi:hypothetical protein
MIHFIHRHDEPWGGATSPSAVTALSFTKAITAGGPCRESLQAFQSHCAPHFKEMWKLVLLRSASLQTILMGQSGIMLAIAMLFIRVARP